MLLMVLLLQVVIMLLNPLQVTPLPSSTAEQVKEYVDENAKVTLTADTATDKTGITISPNGLWSYLIHYWY